MAILSSIVRLNFKNMIVLSAHTMLAHSYALQESQNKQRLLS